MDLFEELNSQQKRAVKYFFTPLIVTAGPGTGKTRVLTAKLIYLLKKRV